jgi:uncharacterized SAM-binding protein YcdF (DUF218 family)
MIYLHKILPTFVLPIMLVIIVIIIGLIKNKKKLIYIAIGILYIISTPIFSNNFFKIVEGSSEYRKPISAIDSADAIVVLSGMLEINEIGDSTYVEWGDPDRFFGGMALFKAGKAQKLVFTGGKMPWDKAKKTEGEVLKVYAVSNGIPSEKIFVTKYVENTADEAVDVKELISPSKRIILVTSAYHMNRAKRLFERQRFEVIPYRVDFKVVGKSRLTILDFLPSADNIQLTENGIREILGRFFLL